MRQFTGVFPTVAFDTTDQQLVSHAGLGVLGSFVNAIGLQELCERSLGQFTPTLAVHRPGKIVGSLALMLAAGGEHVSDLDMLRTNPGLFGLVASNATVSRFFARTITESEAFAHGAATLGLALRSRAWHAAGERSPARSANARNPLIIDLDATLVTSHSDKEQAVGTYKGGYGFAPFVASADYGTGQGTGEILAVLLRPGNAGANSADDHITLLTQALAGLPQEFYDAAGDLMGEKILVRTDSAGASRKFLRHLTDLGMQFSVSYPVPAFKTDRVQRINDKTFWQPALDQEGNERTKAWVVNATDVVGLDDYPQGTNLYLRAEPLHPGANATLLDHDGHRITAFLTNSPRWDAPQLDARHRGRGRCENRIKTLKNIGMGKLPFYDFDANQAWASIAALAMNLISWLQLVALPTGHPGGSWDIKRWRYRLFATAGKLITRARRTRLLLPAHAPEITMINQILNRIHDLKPTLHAVPLLA